MKRVLPFVLLLACSAPAFGQTVDSEGAKQLTDNLARYFSKKPFDIGLLKISVEGDAYKLAFDFKPAVDLLAKQESVKFDFSPYAVFAKPRSDGMWDVSGDLAPTGSLEFNGPQGPQSMQVSVKDGKFVGVYDPELMFFSNAKSSLAGMTMTSQDAMQRTEMSAGAGTATMSATKGANGGADFTLAQTMADFAETVTVDDPKSGMKFPLTINAPELSVDSTGKGLRTKPFLDLLAFAVAHEDEASLKADQAELKSLLLAVLPLWERIDGTYSFKDFKVGSPVGTFGATKLGVAFGMDGVARNGTLGYGIKAAGLTIPQNLVPAWSVALLPTDVDLNFGGANIDLDTMAKKAIEAFDLNKNPPLSEDFGEGLKAGFLANGPKMVIGHSTVKNGAVAVALEGEMTFPGKKPDANVTIDVTGYDKIVASLQEAAKTDPQASQAFTGALAIKGFAKTLPDGRIEWVINAKHDGSVTVNGAMLKGPDPVVEDNTDQDAIPGTATKP
jgi:acylphosphatase